MTILVTGGAGYIGSHCVEELMAQGYSVVVYDSLVTGHEQFVLTPHFVHGDLHNRDLLERTMREFHVEAVIHFAALSQVGTSMKDPQTYYTNNISGTLSLLSAMKAANVSKIIFSSTAATYGNPQYAPIDETHPQAPINPYGYSKLAVERILQDFSEAYGFQAICLRYFNVAGASKTGRIGECHEEETHLVPNIFRSLKAGQPLSIFGKDYDTPDGTCIRDYVHVEDIVSAHTLALASLKSSMEHGTGTNIFKCYNIGTETGNSVLDVVKAAEKVANITATIHWQPRRAGDVAVLVASSQKLRQELGWQPVYTQIEHILQSAWQWENTLTTLKDSYIKKDNKMASFKV
jgi:UDP-glucose 4-epimerase